MSQTIIPISNFILPFRSKNKILLAVLDVEAPYRLMSHCAALSFGIALIVVDMPPGAHGCRIGCHHKAMLTAQD